MFSKRRIELRKQFLDKVEERMTLFKMKKTTEFPIYINGVDHSILARKLINDISRTR